MALITQNMRLTLWNDLDDPYDSTQLVDNFAKIDVHNHDGNLGGVKLNGSTSIVADSITSAELANDSVGRAELLDSPSVDTIRPVVTNTIANYNVTKEKLAANSVDNTKIENNTITFDKMYADSFKVPLYENDPNAGGGLPTTRKDGGELYPGYVIDFTNEGAIANPSTRKYVWRLRFVRFAGNVPYWDYVGGTAYEEYRRTGTNAASIWSTGSGPTVGQFYTRWGSPSSDFQSFRFPLAGNYKVTAFTNAQIQQGYSGVFMSGLHLNDSSPPQTVDNENYTSAFSFFRGDGQNGTVGDQTSVCHPNTIIGATNKDKKYLWQIYGASQKFVTSDGQSTNQGNVGILFQRLHIEPYGSIRNWEL